MAKALDNANIIITGSGYSSSPLACIGANTDNNITFAHYANQTNYTSTANALKYNVISISYDSVNRVSKYYIN